MIPHGVEISIAGGVGEKVRALLLSVFFFFVFFISSALFYSSSRYKDRVER